VPHPVADTASRAAARTGLVRGRGMWGIRNIGARRV
jgi:hypothetical protein